MLSRKSEGIDPTLSDHWPTPPLVFEPGPNDGPVLVSVVYQVAPGDRAAFIDAMDHVARSQRRTGALTWGLFQDGNEPGRFIENYLVGSWAEYLPPSTTAASPPPTGASRNAPARSCCPEPGPR